MSASIDSGSFDYKPNNDPLTSQLKADVGHVIESRIDKMKRFISSPLARRKSVSSTGPESNKIDHKIFGSPIETVAHQSLNEPSDRTNLSKEFCIPFVLQRLCHYIEDNSGFMQEGLFRISGNAKLIEKLKCHFDASGDAPLESEGDIPSAAALLKLFFRELPVPLIPNHFHSSFIEIVQDTLNQTCYNQQGIVDRLKHLVDTLPNENYFILKYLSNFLSQVASNEPHNRMSSSSLGIIFGPNIFRVTTDDYKGIQEQALTNQVVTFFITHYDVIFRKMDFVNVYSHECPQTDVSAKESTQKCFLESKKDFDDFKKDAQNTLLTIDSPVASSRKPKEAKPSSSLNLILFKSGSEEIKTASPFKEVGKCDSFEDIVFPCSDCKNDILTAVTNEPRLSLLLRPKELQIESKLEFDPKYDDWYCSIASKNKEELKSHQDESRCTESIYNKSDSFSSLPPFDIKTLHYNVDGQGAIASEYNYNWRFSNDLWPTRTKDESLSLQNEFSQLNVENTAVKIIKKGTVTSEAPLSPSAYRSFIGEKGASNDDTIPPSPPVDQAHVFNSKNSLIGYEDRALKEMKKKFYCLKKKIKQLETDFEKEKGYRPSHEQKMKSQIFRPLVLEVYRLRKSIKEVKEESHLEKKLYFYEGVLFRLQKNLRHRRVTVGRPEMLEDMSDDELFEEKLDLQRSLLKYESLFGRPRNIEDRTIMRPIYERYRTIKRVMSKNLNFCKDSINLAPILENVAMNFSSFAQTPTSTLLSIDTKGDLVEEEGINSGEQKALLSQSNSNLHQLSLSELIKQLQLVWTEKQQMRKLICDFEEEFFIKNGHKPSKKDKSELEMVYDNYKNLRGKLRLMEALIAKYERN